MMMGNSRGSWVIAATLALAASCAEPTNFTPQAPTVPVPRLPRNDVYQGSVLTGSLRPTFTWEASTAPSAPIRYELQYSTDRMFTSDDTITVPIDEPRYRPDTNLSVSTTPPVGRRYYWHVRACVMESCSEYSPTWWVNLGRSAKDFNGDGYADVAVSEDGFNNNSGRVQLFLGGPGEFDTNQDGYVSNPGIKPQFGRRLAAARDFNGDGFADLLVGALDAAYVFFGQAGTRLDSLRYVALAGEANEGFGASLAAIGDINGDGLSDIAVGAPANPIRGLNTGRVYVYRGGSLGTASEVINGQREETQFGTHLSGGDMNGDGFADLLVAAGGFADEFHAGPCFASLFWGDVERELASEEAITFVGEATQTCSFRAVIAGDLNGDGFADAVGALNPKTVSLMIFSGNKRVSAAPSFVQSLGTGTGFTYSVVAGGDLNGDGFDDVGFGGEQGGVLYLGKDGPSIPVFAAVGGAAIDLYAAAVGDLNGDGFDDLVTVRRNPVPVYFGAAGTSFNDVPDAIISTFISGSRFGDSVAFAPQNAR